MLKKNLRMKIRILDFELLSDLPHLGVAQYSVVWKLAIVDVKQARTYSGGRGGSHTPRPKYCRQITEIATPSASLFNLLYSRKKRGRKRCWGVTESSLIYCIYILALKILTKLSFINRCHSKIIFVGKM